MDLPWNAAVNPMNSFFFEELFCKLPPITTLLQENLVKK